MNAKDESKDSNSGGELEDYDIFDMGESVFSLDEAKTFS